MGNVTLKNDSREHSTYSAKENVMKRARKSMLLKRRRKLSLMKTKIIMVLIALTVILGIIIIVNTVVAHGDAMVRDKGYKSILIERGDTLWDIASEYYDSDSYTIPEYIDELKAINGMEDDNINCGNYLTVSYYK